MKRFNLILISIFSIALTLTSIGAQESEDVISKEEAGRDSIAQKSPPELPDRIIATYFHGDRRCATCLKLEAYSREAIETGFPEKLQDSTLVWRTVNYDREENRHYLKDYELFTKALILSRNRTGAEVEWKNLDKIWELVGNKDDFIKYVQDETRKFIDNSDSHE